MALFVMLDSWCIRRRLLLYSALPQLQPLSWLLLICPAQVGDLT